MTYDLNKKSILKNLKKTFKNTCVCHKKVVSL